LDDIQQLFGYSIIIESVQLTESGDAIVEARKERPLQLSEDALSTTDISRIDLSLTVSSIDDLDAMLENLESFYGNGLTSARVSNTKRLNTGEYLVRFILTL
jgi:hypothetical protein